MPEAHCVECGEKFDGASGVNDDRRPQPNDYSLCIYCGALGVFTEQLTLRRPTDDEIREVAGDRNLVKASEALAELHKEVAKNPAKYGVSGPKKPA